MVVSQVGSMSRDVSAVAAYGALVALAALLGVSALVAWRVTRADGRTAQSPLVWFACLASLSVIVAVTLFRDGVPSTFDLAGMADWSADGARMVSRDPLGSSQFLLNVALFVPAGASCSWLLRRPLRVAAALVGVSLLVELVQGVTGTGAPDVADLVANGLGGALGAGAAALVGGLPAAWFENITVRRRRTIGVGAGLAVLVVVTAGLVGASRHQQSVEDALRAAFTGTDRSSIETRLASDPNAVFGAVSDFANGSFTSETTLEIRYPADFYGMHRCVYVIWTATGVEFDKASGDDCTRRIDETG